MFLLVLTQRVSSHRRRQRQLHEDVTRLVGEMDDLRCIITELGVQVSDQAQSGGDAVRTVRAECPDWTLICNEPATGASPVERIDVLDGLIHEYHRAA